MSSSGVRLLLMLAVVSSGCAAIPPRSADATARSAPAVADCNRLSGLGGQPETFQYEMLGSLPRGQRFQIYPCGQTVIRENGSDMSVPVLACKTQPDLRCFEDRYQIDGPSRFFLAIPRDFEARERHWSADGVEFHAVAASGGDEADIAMITAKRIEGTHHPEIQRFVFSIRVGLLMAVVGDTLAPSSRTYWLKSGPGILANHGEGSYALNRRFAPAH